LQAAGERKRLAHNAIEHRPTHAGRARGFERTAQLGRNLALARLSRVEAAGDQEEVLDRRLANPGAQRRARLARGGYASCQRVEHFRTQVARAMPVGHREHDFHAIAGGEINELGRAQRPAQRREALSEVVFGEGEPGDVIRAGVAIREAHDADLVHRRITPRAGPGCVTE
jgi:hypothetical protein